MTLAQSQSIYVIEKSSLKRAIFVDLAASRKTSADYTVIATVGKDTEQNIYILDIQRGRWTWPRAYGYIVSAILDNDIRLAGAETNGFQLAAFQELVSDERLADVAFYPVPVDSDKVSRSLVLSARGAAGKLYYAKGASWAEDLITEFVRFPNAAHDDIVDAVSGCVYLLNNFEVGDPIVELDSIYSTPSWRS